MFKRVRDGESLIQIPWIEWISELLAELGCPFRKYAMPGVSRYRDRISRNHCFSVSGRDASGIIYLYLNILKANKGGTAINPPSFSGMGVFILGNRRGYLWITQTGGLGHK